MSDYYITKGIGPYWNERYEIREADGTLVMHGSKEIVEMDWEKYYKNGKTRLRDIKGMEQYLKTNDGAVYDRNFKVCRKFYTDMECKVLAEGKTDSFNGILVLVKDQILLVAYEGEHVNFCIRYDATENNRKQMKDYMEGKIKKVEIDDFGEAEFPW